jgi:hypothetical protein
VINLIRLYFILHTEDTGKTFQRGGMKHKLVDNVPDPPKPVFRVFNGNSADNPMDFVTLLQKQIGKIGTILTRYARYQCFLHFVCSANKII